MVVDGAGVGNYLGFVGQEDEPCQAGHASAAASTRTYARTYTHSSKHRGQTRPGQFLCCDELGPDL